MEFKTSVFELYPNADDKYKYTLADMESLIARCQRLNKDTLANLAKYHAHFLAITTSLIHKQQLLEIEQKHTYNCGFPPAIWTKILQQLQLRFFDHFPDNLYDISDVYSAAHFVLHGTCSSKSILPTPPYLPASSSSTPNSTSNYGQLGSILSELNKLIVTVINNNQQLPHIPLPPTESGPQKMECNFCGQDHFIRECALVEEYKCAGKLKHDNEGKIILSTGVYLPHDIPGHFLKDCIDK